jgi:hypothetical protein
MHVPINVKSPNNISKWQIGFNSTFKGLICQNHGVIYNIHLKVIPLSVSQICK